MTPTRGERNNNPGNIREAKGDLTHWLGERATDDDPAFEEFERPEDGIRAVAVLLKNYIKKRHNTITKIVNRYAPASENNVQAYIDHVVKVSGIRADNVVRADPATLKALTLGIIMHENGRNKYADELITQAVKAAL